MTIASMGQGGSSLPGTVSRELARNTCAHGGDAKRVGAVQKPSAARPSAPGC